MKQKTYTAAEAATLARFFAALERTIANEVREGDHKNAGAIAHLMGGLQYRCFETSALGDSFGVEA